MDPFIEVIGQGTLTEKVAEYRMDLSVTVRATQGDAALKEATELRYSHAIINPIRRSCSGVLVPDKRIYFNDVDHLQLVYGLHGRH